MKYTRHVSFRGAETEVSQLESQISQAKQQLIEIGDKLEAELSTSTNLKVPVCMWMYVCTICNWELLLHYSCTSLQFFLTFLLLLLLCSIQAELECSQQECSALQDHLQLQRESAALSLNRIQQHHNRKMAQISQRVKDLQRKLKEVRYESHICWQYLSYQCMSYDICSHRCQRGEPNLRVLHTEQSFPKWRQSWRS